MKKNIGVFLSISLLFTLSLVILVLVWKFDQVTPFFSKAASSSQNFDFNATGFNPRERVSVIVRLSDGREIPIRGETTNFEGGVRIRATSDSSWPSGPSKIIVRGESSGKEQVMDFTYGADKSVSEQTGGKENLSPEACRGAGGEVGPVVVEKWRSNPSEDGGGHCDSVSCDSGCCFASCQCTGTCGAERPIYNPPPATETQNGPQLQGSSTCSSTAPNSPACQGDKVYGECMQRTNNNGVQCGFEAGNRYMTVLAEEKEKARKSENPEAELAKIERQTQFDQIETTLRQAAACKDQFGKQLDRALCLDSSGKQVHLPDKPEELEKIVKTVYSNGDKCPQGSKNFAECVAQSGVVALNEQKALVAANGSQSNSSITTPSVSEKCSGKSGPIQILGEYLDCTSKKIVTKDEFDKQVLEINEQKARKTCVNEFQLSQNSSQMTASGITACVNAKLKELAQNTNSNVFVEKVLKSQTFSCFDKFTLAFQSVYSNGEKVTGKQACGAGLECSAGECIKGSVTAMTNGGGRVPGNAMPLPSNVVAKQNATPVHTREEIAYGNVEEFCEKQKGSAQTGCIEKYTNLIKEGYNVSQNGVVEYSEEQLIERCKGTNEIIGFNGTYYFCEESMDGGPRKATIEETVAIRNSLKNTNTSQPVATDFLFPTAAPVGDCRWPTTVDEAGKPIYPDNCEKDIPALTGEMIESTIEGMWDWINLPMYIRDKDWVSSGFAMLGILPIGDSKGMLTAESGSKAYTANSFREFIEEAYRGGFQKYLNDLFLPGGLKNSISPAIREGEVFDSAAEVQQILKLPKAERGVALSDLKSKLAYQRRGIGEMETALTKKIGDNPDVPFNDLDIEISKYAKKYGFTEKQKQVALQVAENYSIRRNELKRYRQQYPDDKKLFKALFGFEPKGEVKIGFGSPDNFYVQPNNLDDFVRLTQNEVGVERNLAFFRSQLSVDPLLRDSVFVVRGDVNRNSVGFTQAIVHEGQHSVFSSLQSSLGSSQRTNKFTSMISSLSQVKSEKDADVAIQASLDYAETFIQEKAADEVLAQIAGKGDTADVAEIMQTYDYFGTSKPVFVNNVRNFVSGDPKFTDYVVTEFTNRLGNNTAKLSYNKSIEEGLRAYDELIEHGYTFEEAIDLLQHEQSLRDWPKAVKRLLNN